VASCVTLYADLTGIPEFGPGGTRPRSDRRNRFYLGPLGRACGHEDTTVHTWRPSTQFMADVTKSTKQYLQAAASGHGWQLMVFSPKNWSALGALSASVDDAFDTQRRRGLAPTAKTSIEF